jgi:hypothetical protein
VGALVFVLNDLVKLLTYLIIKIRARWWFPAVRAFLLRSD